MWNNFRNCFIANMFCFEVSGSRTIFVQLLQKKIQNGSNTITRTDYPSAAKLG